MKATDYQMGSWPFFYLSRTNPQCLQEFPRTLLNRVTLNRLPHFGQTNLLSLYDVLLQITKKTKNAVMQIKTNKSNPT